MNIKLPAVALLTMIVPTQAHAATLTDAEAMFLDQLVTAAAVLVERCAGYEVDGAGGVQVGARLLGSTNAAMAMIEAFDAAVKAHDGVNYDPGKFRPEVFEAAGKMSTRLRADLANSPNEACAHYGNAGVESGLLRRY